MFKNLIVFRLKPTWNADFSDLEGQMANFKFVPCGPTTMRSSGWVEPRGQAHGALVESVNGHWIMRLCIETKVVPGSVVKRAVQARLEKIEEQEGRKPGKKETREIKDEVMLDLLPKAFTKVETVMVCVDFKDKFVLVDAGSLSKADDIVSAMVQTFENFGVDLLMTKSSPQSAMSHWLQGDGAPLPFEIGQEVELKALESKSVVKYSRHNLNIAEVKAHVATGKVPTKLELQWNARVTFTLTDALGIKKITFNDPVFEEDQADKEDAFDADLAIFTGEISEMLPNLIEVLGGEMFNEPVLA